MSYKNINIQILVSKLEELVEKKPVDDREIDFILRRIINEAEIINSDVLQKILLECEEI